MRLCQIAFGILAVVLSTCFDLPATAPIRVKRDGFILIDAGTINSMFAFPAYVYLTTIAVITLLGAIVFLLLLLVDLSLAKADSEHESIRFKIDNNIPFVALCFDFIFLILSMTSACAVLGLTNVMNGSLDTDDLDPTSKQRADLMQALEIIFHLKYAASACMIGQSIFITATLVLGWQHIEERRKQQTALKIPAQATQQSIDKIFSFWTTISSGVGKRSEEIARISPLFLNRVVQVLLSMSAFVCCYLLIQDAEVIFDHVVPFVVITWVSLAILITTFGIAAISAIDISLTGGSKSHKKDTVEERAAVESSAEYKGIIQSSSAEFKEKLIYCRIIYDSVFSLLTFCTFAAAAGVTSARLNCKSGDSRWCALSGLSVFFVFMQSVSFMISLFTGSYPDFSRHRTKQLTLEVHTKSKAESL